VPLTVVIYGLEDFMSRRYSSCNQSWVCSVYRSYSGSYVETNQWYCVWPM